MAVRFSRLAPAAAQQSPDQEAREQSLRALRLELEAQSDAGLSALLQHEIARLHERREDLASAARDELATTKHAAGFVEPVESLIDIATRSRSKANLTKLLARLGKLARTASERLRTALALSLTQLSSGDFEGARSTIEDALEESPAEPVLWLALETVAAETGDTRLLLKSAMGRAAHADSEEMRGLLLERVARLEIVAGTTEAAFAALRQSVDELPAWRSLRAWEELGLRTGSYNEAETAALQTATIIRAALEEPEEAALYKVPKEELSEERAIAAHVRAIVYALRSGSEESARGLAEQLAETSPHSAFAISLLLELSRKQGDARRTSESVGRLIEARRWNIAELAPLCALRALAARQADDAEEYAAALKRLREVAPRSLLPALEEWESARAEEKDDAVIRLFEGWAKSAPGMTPEAKDGEADALRLSVALVGFLSGNAGVARKALERRTNEGDVLGGLFSYVAQALEAAGLESTTLPPGVGATGDIVAIGWERIRRALLSAVRPAEDVMEENAVALTRDPWATLALSLFVSGLTTPTDEIVTPSASTEAMESTDLGQDGAQPNVTLGDVAERATPGKAGDAVPPPSKSTRRILKDYLSESEGTAAFRRALQIAEIAGWGDRSQLRNAWEANPKDPLLSGAYLYALDQAQDPTLALKRRQAAERQEDSRLRAAWLLRSAADELTQQNARRARDAYDASDVFPGDAELDPWFAALEGPRDPQTLALGSDFVDDQLEAAALTRRFAPDKWNALDLANPSPALQLLQILHQAPKNIEALEYALDDSEFFTKEERAALPLSRTFEMNESSELLEASARWVAAAPSGASRMTHWVAATRAKNAEIQAKMIEALATDLNAPSLLAAIPSGHLKKESQNNYRALLQSYRQAADGTAAQSLSWAIFEHTADGISEEHAGEAWRLSEALDLGLDDPDAQGALLLAGYEYLVLGRFEEATQVFERLLEVLPGDLALCHGARIAAARVNRPDLEAITSCELARATEDNLKSAALWERAGVLFQDELDDREEAEKCFTAALSRSPGSRVSFERVYRFARDRNDRSRQVELIDARLDTADSESLRIELYWEKARFCRMLGRRTIALRALDELLKLAPDHLPAMALAAELHLVDGRIDAAAETLKAVALHPDTPASQRGAAGLHACDLFEQLRRHRDAVELLQVLDEYGVSGSAGLERQARSLARSEDWGEAYKTFANLNDEQDEIETRLESARMMLAIQRDHLKDPEELKRSARCVLRDSPLDSDAIQIVLEQNFAPEERRRLLTPARGQSREILRRNPLNPPEIRRFAGLCLDCGEDYLERIALGLRGLTGKLSGSAQVRLDELLTNCLRLPSQPLSDSDIEAISDPLLLGATGRFLTLLAPYLSEELEPSLEALGFSSLMRTDEFSGSPHRAEIGTWMGCFGLNDFELYVGGNDPHLISSRQSDLPTILVGKDVAVPLQPKDRARVVTQLAALRRGTAIYLNQSPEELKKWLMASEILVGGTPPGGKTDELSELARLLSKVIPRETREELGNLYTELSRAGVELSLAPFAAMRSAARAACLAQGEPKILRELSDIIPSDQDLLNASMSDVVRFILSGEFITIRRRIGLEGA